MANSESESERSALTVPAEGTASKELFQIALNTRNLEIGLFWQRSNYFLVLNSGLALGFFSLKNSEFALALSILGVLTSSLWFCICLGSKYWQTRWEQGLSSFERQHFPHLKFFAAEPSFLDEIVREGLSLERRTSFKWLYKLVLVKPSVSLMMTMLSVFFAVAWIGFVASTILAMLS